MNEKPKIWQSVVCLIILIGLSFYHAYVFKTIYNWFIPLATGWTPISYWLAFGIMTFISFIRYHSSKDDDDETVADYVKKVLASVIIPSLFLGVSALINIGIYYGGA